MSSATLATLPAELWHMIADRLPDSTSRIRMAAVLSRDLIREHDSRLSLMEYIKCVTGSLDVDQGHTLHFLIKHQSELALEHVGTPLHRLATLLGDIERCVLRDLASYPAAEELEEFLWRSDVWRYLGRHATPEFFERFRQTPLFPAIQRRCDCAFSSGLCDNPTLLRHVWNQPWFQDCKWTNRREFYHIMGAPRSEWLTMITRRVMVDPAWQLSGMYAKMVAAEE